MEVMALEELDGTSRQQRQVQRRRQQLLTVNRERKTLMQQIKRILEQDEACRTPEENDILAYCPDVVEELVKRTSPSYFGTMCKETPNVARPPSSFVFDPDALGGGGGGAGPGRKGEGKKRVQDQEERRKEVEDPPDELERKCQILADAIQSASHLIVYTGAGVSTAANIPDYRGPNGVWTNLQKGKQMLLSDPIEACPTYTHMALTQLYKEGIVKHVLSQNCDGLHLRSGLPRSALSEIHGNMFIEVCRRCSPLRLYVRLFDVTERTSRNRHKTGRICYVCGGHLEDTIVHFGEKGRLRWPLNWEGVKEAVDKCDMILCLGSSCKVLRHYPGIWGSHRPAKQRPKLYIVNLQWTPKDLSATLKINGRCDQVMSRVMEILRKAVPEYKLSGDPIFYVATPLHPAEINTTTKLSLQAPKQESPEIPCLDYKPQDSSRFKFLPSDHHPYKDAKEEDCDMNDSEDVPESSSGPAKFTPPVIQDNPNGWGPRVGAVPDKFKDMPYQPFSKGDRLGKVSDWYGATYQDRKYANKYQSSFGAGSQYAYYHEEDESSFQLVDTTRVQKPLYQRGRYMRGRGGRNQRGQQRQQQSQVLGRGFRSKDKDRARIQRRLQKQFGNRQRYDQQNRQPVKMRESSVTVKPDWKVIEEMDFPRLSKLSLPNVEDGIDLKKCGSLEYYDRYYDRVNTKTEKPLQRIDRIFHKVTTTDDPIIRQLAKENAGQVFATDAILAAIMCCTRSVYSWDVVIQKIGNKLFLDKRDDSEFDLLTVSESSNEPPQDEGASINSPRSLALEALFINHNFSQQVLRMGEETCKFEGDNPFVSNEEEGEVASVGYRYRKWDLGNDITLVARCEHDAVTVGPNQEIQFINVKALNEWDPRFSGGIEWRQKLDTQRGAVLANELKNNSSKLAKWTVQSILAGSDQIKFGYVSRVHVRDSTRHVILGTQQFKPMEFANQINLSMGNAWGILRCIVDLCLKLEDGKYLIVKDPNKPMVRLYDIPDNTFESEEEGSSDEEDNAPKIYPQKLEKLVNDISQLTLIEVSELNELLKKRLNIPDAPMMPFGSMMAMTAGAPKEEEEEAETKQQQTNFTLKLTKFDEAKKVALIKEIKGLIEGMNLVQAKKFVEGVPQVVRKDIPKEDAEKLKDALEKVGDVGNQGGCCSVLALMCRIGQLTLFIDVCDRRSSPFPFLALVFLSVLPVNSFPEEFIGCFAYNETKTELHHSSLPAETVDDCIGACKRDFYKVAALFDGGTCLCGSSYGREGPAHCNKVCRGNSTQVCGDTSAISVFFTGHNAPGPPASLDLVNSTGLMTIRWSTPLVTNGELTQYRIWLMASFSYSQVEGLPPGLEWIVTSGKDQSQLVGVRPGTQYNVSVAASNKAGEGPPTSKLFWSKLGDPPIPHTPELIDIGDETLTMHLEPVLATNGPISAYQVIAIDESSPVVFNPKMLTDWSHANSEGIPYYIAAEIPPEDLPMKFVVGDGNIVGGYHNHPLPTGKDFHVILGVVSRLNGETKSSYARPGHEQHSHFDHTRTHDHEGNHAGPKKTVLSDTAYILVIAIGVFGALLVVSVLVYVALRLHIRMKRRRQRTVDRQELAVHMQHNHGPTPEPMEHAYISSAYLPEDEEEQVKEEIGRLESRFHQVSPSAFNVQPEVLGQGNFGFVRLGFLARDGKDGIAVAIHSLVEGKLGLSELSNYLNDLQVTLTLQKVPSVLHILGICLDGETTHILCENHPMTLKQFLLESRALVHYPVYAEKQRRICTLKSGFLFQMAAEIASGMTHLTQLQLSHKRLCARNISVVEGRLVRIGGLPLSHYHSLAQAADYTRWKSQESLGSPPHHFLEKSDVWSFSVLLWEIATLGGTPYADVPSNQVGSRVSKGARLAQVPVIQDDLYQLMLQCWMVDPAERPSFAYLTQQLQQMASNTLLEQMDFSLTPGFRYEPFLPELEHITS
ncbi:unnamed protein product [Darwinula stevensoni]|uniref:Eukaryotic translation initiation factor 3 subunit D n=1 Tax=Darwinula stevensoni TaxID=69355 RepID=A0A7R9A2D3_9CRUS|nr:unnamed protein product [Darwinula stevensoni]CAG0888523.1 unnamed protein product [Darwinula stevensoni]